MAKGKNAKQEKPATADEDAAASSAPSLDVAPKKSRQPPLALPKDFSLDAPKLPKAIEDAAMRSGGYPYDKRMKRKLFEKDLHALQIELAKLQKHNSRRAAAFFASTKAATAPARARASKPSTST